MVVLGVGSYVFEPQLYRIFTDDPAVIAVGKELMFLVGVFGFVNGTMDTPFNVVRGMGRSLFPMVSSLLCICVLRVVWVCTVFAWFPTLTALFLCFPVAKGLASVTGIFYYHRTMRKVKSLSARA